MAQPARDYLSIGEVLVTLKPEFPDVTISKIRFLESEGLIAPERTASGYRKFYDADVQRLRTILKLQRDEYLPLRVIRERLDGGAAETATESGRRPALDPEDEVVEPATALQMTADELASATGVDVSVVESLASFGLLRPVPLDGGAVFGGDDVVILRIVKDFFKFGVEARHLTMYRHFADREASFFQQIVVPILRQRNPEARRMAQESLAELTGISRRLKQALLRANLRRFVAS
jgi:DNA-binding transcriptional MerR regulator